MTTTPETRTPEQIVQAVLLSNPVCPEHEIVADLRAAGLLGGDPTEEQVRRALDAYTGEDFYAKYPGSVGYWEPRMRAALAAAGLAPQESSRVCDDDGCLHYDHSPAPSPDREKLIRQALESVREIGESGLAGVPLSSIPKDVDSNWGWLQRQWPVVVAIDTALAAQPVLDPEKVAEVIHSAHQRRWCLNGDGEACPESRQIARAICEAAKRGELS